MNNNSNMEMSDRNMSQQPQQNYGGYPMQNNGGYPIQNNGGYPIQNNGGYPMQNNGDYQINNGNYQTNNDDYPPQQNYQNYSQQQPYSPTNYAKNVQPGMQDNIQADNPPTYIISQPAKQPDPLAHLDQSLAGKARKKFIMKVYLILAIQFLITAGMCFAAMYSFQFMLFQVNNPWLFYTLLAIIFIVEIVIFCCPAGRRHPINLILLLIFTLGQSYIVSYICAIVAYQNGSPQIVVVAACMTFAIVLALSLYAVFTRTDFTIKWGIVVVILVAMCMFGLFCIWSYVLYNLYCMLGVILFGIYLVIDTQLIIGGKRLALSMDDYVVGALLLYIDIIQIFLYILALMGRR